MLYLFATRAALIGLTACAAVALFGGCAGTYESAVRHDIDTVRARHDWPVDTSGSGTALSRTQADSLSTGVRDLPVAPNRVARVRLTGGCSSGGSTFTVANLISPTLKQFPTVRWVKIYDPAGTTESPTGQSDSIPECLEP